MNAIPVRLLAEADAVTAAEVLRTLTFRAGFNTSLVVAGSMLLGLAAGLVGAFALLRKRSLMADALSHATLPGLCAAFLVASSLGISGKSALVLLIGAGVSGVATVLVVQWLARHPRVREDAAIGAGLSVSFGLGVVLLSAVPSVSSAPAAGLSRFIFGQTAAMLPADAALMAGIALVSAAAVVLLHKELALVSFNEGFAQVSGWPVKALDTLLLALVVLVTVAGIQAVGIILVVSMFIIPAVSARFWTDRLGRMVALSGAFGAASGYLGAAASALLPRAPAGSVIVLVAGGVFVLSMLASPRRGVAAGVWRRAALRLRIATDHLVESMIEADGEGTTVTTESLRRARGWGQARVRAALLAALIRGLVEPAAEGWRLTPRGSAGGARVARNHRLWTRYLTTHADVAPSHVDWSVDQVEHVLPDEVVRELEAQDRGADA